MHAHTFHTFRLLSLTCTIWNVSVVAAENSANRIGGCEREEMKTMFVLTTKKKRAIHSSQAAREKYWVQ